MNTVKELLDLNLKIENIKLKLEDKLITVAENESLKCEISNLQKRINSIAKKQYDKYIKFAISNKALFKDWNVPYFRSVHIDSFKIKESKNAILVKAYNNWDGESNIFYILIPFLFISDNDAYLRKRKEYVKELMLKNQKEKLHELHLKRQSIMSEINMVNLSILNFDSFFEEKMEEYRKN